MRGCPALEYVSRPMQSVGIDFFQRGGHKYLLLMDHFSGWPLYEEMTLSADTEHTIRQLKRWFATFGVARSIRCDKGLPFQGREFKEFNDEYKIKLDLTSPYNPESSGAAEHGVGLIKMIKKKTETEGLDMEEALVVFRNTRNESGYSPNELFFLRNWRDPKLPDLRAKPVLEEMVKARERVKGGCYKVKEDKLKAAWPALNPGDMVRGQHPQTKEWSLKGQVLEMVHGNRAVNVDLDDGRTRLFARDDVRKDTTRAFMPEEEEQLQSQLAGTGLEPRPDEQLEEPSRGRKRNQRPNVEEAPPRKSLRLAKKSVTIGAQGTVDDPERLPYYRQAVGSVYAGIRQSMVMPAMEEEDTHEKAAREQSDTEVQDGGEVFDKEVVGENAVEEL